MTYIHVFHQIMYFIKSCISSNHVFHQIMYFIKSCISSNHVFHHRRCAAYFQRTVPWSRPPLCVFGDRYSEYEMRSSPPSRRRLLPAYLPLVPSTIMRARRQVQRVRDEKFPAVAAPPTSSVPPPGPEHHYACSETGTAGTR